MHEFSDIRIAYGVSDEYSFVLHPATTLYGRRSSKIVSVITSCFAASYVRWWGDHMGAATPLRTTPVFDGRAVCYPNAQVLRDYLAWRQVDCHINNQVRKGLGWVCHQQRAGFQPSWRGKLKLASHHESE